MTRSAWRKRAGRRALSEKSGIAHLAADDEAECLEMVRELLSYLPQNNLEETPLRWTEDPVDRMDEELERAGLRDPDDPHDVRAIIAGVVDDGRFMEIMPRWAKNLVVGFGRLAGRAVGVVANQAAHLEGRLDQDAAAKGGALRALLRCLQPSAGDLRRYARASCRPKSRGTDASCARRPSSCTPIAKPPCRS